MTNVQFTLQQEASKYDVTHVALHNCFRRAPCHKRSFLTVFGPRICASQPSFPREMSWEWCGAASLGKTLAQSTNQPDGGVSRTLQRRPSRVLSVVTLRGPQWSGRRASKQLQRRQRSGERKELVHHQTLSVVCEGHVAIASHGQVLC